MEFLETTWKNIVFPNNLLNLMRNERGIYLDEIFAQADFASLYWYNLLGFSRADKPWTARLIDIAVQIGLMAVSHYKEGYKRARPSEICPGLFPPFGPPGHASFPSGHATQAYLISLCLHEIPGISTRYPHNPPPAYPGQLMWLAERVATNRERAGLHYPSDSAAGKFLAEKILNILKADIANAAPKCKRFKEALSKAKNEWL
jgi:membrane-associated phospholipid phosphatase